MKQTIKIPVYDFLKQRKYIPVIDVRSPQEFNKAHIPGAINLPLFNNEERARVGTIYKQKGKNKAILTGLEIVGPKMKSFVVSAQQVAGKNKKLLIHCWRGGMRSESMAWLFNTAGIDTIILDGGYKAYRQYIKNNLNKKLKL